MNISLTLDDQQYAWLAELAAAAKVQPATLARSLLVGELQRAAEAKDDPADASELGELLARIPGADAKHSQGLEDLVSGRVVPLDDP